MTPAEPRPITVLVVEDDPAQARLVQLLVTSAGLACVGTAASSRMRSSCALSAISGLLISCESATTISPIAARRSAWIRLCCASARARSISRIFTTRASTSGSSWVKASSLMM